MNIQPLHKNVLVKKVVIGGGMQQTGSGLFVPTMPHRDDRHEVIALGPECTLPILPGDIVFIPPTVPANIVEVDRAVLKFVNEKDIWGKEEA